ncbi:unnamed protein product [Brachionus calyciflorus]|uniref:Uncharacterized protein n=1 Tax=Brachionus calyciflorus TaxID=104777 RepID=A0A813RBR0_9BILA|nr:unnamed protein product [Brachionus calyciflorus]
MNFETNQIKNFQLPNLNSNSINSFDFIDNSLLTCCESELNLFNLETKSKTTIYKATNEETEELGCFKLIDNKNALVSNQNYVHLFDINTQKELNKFNFFQETVNCLELNKQGNVLVGCDDSGEIKLLDLRIQSDIPNLSLHKSLKQHQNICYCLKFHPMNEYELFSGSFDCTFVKWDIRFPKAKDSKKQFVKKVAISEELEKVIKSQNDDTDFMLSTMTPSFVHSLFFTEIDQNKMGLLCGIENGYAMLFDPDTCKLSDGKQLTNNLAVTQFDKFEKVQEKNLLVTSGDSKIIEFIYFDKKEVTRKNKSEIKYELEKFQDMKIDFKRKVNCLKFRDNKLYIADTSNSLTVFDFEDYFKK